MTQIPKYSDEGAFPRPAQFRLEHEQVKDLLLPAQWGLTKREYFAAKVMQAMCTTTPWAQPGDIWIVASRSVLFADALLDELSK